MENPMMDWIRLNWIGLGADAGAGGGAGAGGQLG